MCITIHSYFQLDLYEFFLDFGTGGKGQNFARAVKEMYSNECYATGMFEDLFIFFHVHVHVDSHLK